MSAKRKILRSLIAVFCLAAATPSWASIAASVEQSQMDVAVSKSHRALPLGAVQLAGVDWSWTWWQFGAGCAYITRPMPTNVTLKGRVVEGYRRYEMGIATGFCLPM